MRSRPANLKKVRPARALLPLLWLGAAVLGGRVFLDMVWKVRDPARTPPSDPRAVLAPADGLILHLRRIEGGRVHSDLLGEDLGLEEITGLERGEQGGWLIGIYVGALDVRFSSAPFSGTLARSVDVPGRDLDPLLSPLELGQLALGQPLDVVGRPAHLESGRHVSVLESERLSAVLVHLLARDEDLQMAVRPGDRLRPGARIGRLERGGLVELVLLREELEFGVGVGDRVQAGLTVLARGV